MDQYVKSVEIKLDATKSIKKIADDFKNEFKVINDDIGKKLATTLKSIFSSVVSDFKTLLLNAVDEMQTMLDYSQLSNANTRNLAFGYGFSSSEAYAWTKALATVGLSSEEDLYYADEQERRQFRESFIKYSEKYNELYDSGFFNTLQEYQYEMSDFKNEIQLEIIGFFMENKELIKNGMKSVMSMSETLLKIFTWLANIFGKGVQSDLASTTDIVSQYTTTNNSRNNTVSVTNTFNNVAKEDESWLANAGSMTYEQVIQALGGKS